MIIKQRKYGMVLCCKKLKTFKYEGLDWGSQKSLIVKIFAPLSLLDKTSFTKISIFEDILAVNCNFFSHKNRLSLKSKVINS